MGFRLFFFLIPLLLFAVPGYYEPWGKDTDVKHQIPSEEKISLSSLGCLMEQLIYFHQNVLSPVDGPRSHFKPSSSQYMLDAIHKYGFFKGYLMGCDRLLRENNDSWVYRTAIIEGERWKVDFID